MNRHPLGEPLPAVDDREDGSWSILDFLTALGEQKRAFIVITVGGTLLSLATALVVPRTYSASTVLLPPRQQQGATLAALAQLGALASLAGAVSDGPATDDVYVAFLKTRRLQDALIKRFNLRERFKVPTLTDARATLSMRVMAVTEKKSGLITVSVDDADPKFAAELANAYAEELRHLLASLAVTDAQQRRQFFDQQVQKAKQGLVTAELAFRRAQAESGWVVSDALAQSGIKAGVDLRAQIAAREVQLEAISRFATAQNPEAQRIAAELGAYRQQLARLEEGGKADGTPKGGFDAVQAYRDMRVQEASLQALIQQAEIAKLDEARDGPLLQQVDAAVPPEYPTKPSRTLIVIAGAMLSALLGAAVALVRSFMRQDGGSGASRWRKVRDAWR